MKKPNKELYSHAVKLFQQHNFSEAEIILSSIISDFPEYDPAVALLAGIAHSQGDFCKAVKLMQRAISINPASAAYNNNIGNLYLQLKQYHDALPHLKFVTNLQPENLHALLQLGKCYEHTGNLEDAIECYNKAISLNPTLAECHYTLGCLYLKKSNYAAAKTSLNHAISLKAGYSEAQIAFGDVLRLEGYFEEAIRYYSLSLSNPNPIKPALVYSNIGTCKQYLGEIGPAVTFFRQAMQLAPDRYELYTNYLMALNYSDLLTLGETYKEHCQFNSIYTCQLWRDVQNHNNSKDPGRPLKIGYVSSDFYDHSVSHFIRPVLKHHNRNNFIVYAYCNSHKNDAITQQIKNSVPNWRNITSLTDDSVATLIKEDGIDILIDLNGHTADNRLLVFARKPAPLQITWIGYPNTTGLSTIDYRITDPIADPIGLSEHLHSEQLIRLPEIFSCYSPPNPCPEVCSSPALDRGCISFGSFNNFAKVGPKVLKAWIRILKQSPNSLLVLKDRLFQSTITRNKVTNIFQQAGIEPNRIRLLSTVKSKTAHLAQYTQIDIALDTFPYNGTTTTCEALWMGCPTITLRGVAHAGRVGASLLTNVGLGELIADSHDQYVEKAIRLANELGYLQHLRSTLRQRMNDSPLIQAEKFTEALESALRRAWMTWCKNS